ncbi:hypothetical protein A3I48_03570 [Candidatus Daviesbacteria bacterium RIFCSPLOWO2_02_FULL_36_7]|uniref:Uncharacterized protein n=1 Tax=Candidatus Daviesbacteria bacterium RIFCSPLOWO2_02_FULL_36_7 TaxID=1797792 RepID=A0A1F5MGN1_9BACT|nr:MAG: hypothetical protein A3I48_03570 [Candidatus Daviesbacteria bacterium RIFCSPLOWO2_02_FULL_36_7]
MKQNNQPLIEFNQKLPKLSKNESQVLKLLVEAGRLIIPVYLEQEKQVDLKIDKKEVEQVAKKDPNILSSYSVIEKLDGKLIAIPYHVKYAKFLKPIAEKLEEAAKLTENKEFGKALKIQAKALLDGTYEQAIAAWLKVKPYILDISIGPVEHFDDQLFSGKASYQAWVGTLDTEGTKRLNRYKTITLSARRKALEAQERIDNLDKVKAKTIDVILFSGFMAKAKFVGVNFPMNINTVKKYGSEITIFNQPNDLRLKEQIMPTFQNIFSKFFRGGFSSEDIRRGNLRYIALHELAHSYLYYKNAVANLKDLFISIYELAATVLGLRMAGLLLLEDVITSKQLESMIVTFLCRSFYLVRQHKQDRFMVNRALGSAIFINYMRESGALKQSRGLIVPNFMKIFVSSHELSNTLERLLSSGTRQDAQDFIKKYGES